MSLLASITLGVFTGIVAHTPIKRKGTEMLLDIGLGTIGAIGGGRLFNRFGAMDTSHISPNSLLIAGLGAIIILALYHSIADD